MSSGHYPKAQFRHGTGDNVLESQLAQVTNQTSAKATEIAMELAIVRPDLLDYGQIRTLGVELKKLWGASRGIASLSPDSAHQHFVRG